MSATHGTQGTGHKEPWAFTMGSFRFLNNPAVTLPALYQPCFLGLTQLIPEGARCYIAHDISVLDYSHHHAKHDRIRVGDHRGLGYELFTSLVLDASGHPIGPAAQELRTLKGCLSSESEEPLPFVDHFTQVERSLSAVDMRLPNRFVVDILDREFDDVLLERFFFVHQRHFIIRAQHLNRRVLFEGAPTSLAQVVSQLTLQPAGQVERQGQLWELFQGETQVTFYGDSYRGCARNRTPSQPGASIQMRVVVAELRQEGSAPLRWVLLTNLVDPMAEVVQAYVWRWRIERFFFLTKVGFRLTVWRQESGDGIARRLGVSMFAAMVIYQLQAAVDDVAAQQTLRQIAKLGGWLGRKGDRMGPIVLMRGMLLLLGMRTAMEEYGEGTMRRLMKRAGDLIGW